MQDIKLSAGDIQLDYITGSKEIIQSAEIILGTRKGEFVLAPEMGLNHSNLLGKKYAEEMAASDVYEAVRQEERIKNVKVDTKVDKHNRSITLNLTADIGNDKPVEMEVNYA
ncbi:GPW/gp25 family protein [Limosilactobacillus sp. STM2_1]|uniref:GPW/gp25 family protein n=1 Tax=Limosilactobacillus rudii TaxID=2759755 RepID=A0A7W3YN17_9LACO|nr:GPW/gp25 family protein [Limosilactobacillus rudii]MBB1078974.1 GPW/gp25 family protein [Limosilactobacillus rudii]MBB1097155.1 GPW/gp25 family protein [Limosilactobacillus rudii]MCD7134148.1 GPW/gp25 family protein [Limosilactobacillus rudii]